MTSDDQGDEHYGDPSADSPLWGIRAHSVAWELNSKGKMTWSDRHYQAALHGWPVEAINNGDLPANGEDLNRVAKLAFWNEERGVRYAGDKDTYMRELADRFDDHDSFGPGVVNTFYADAVRRASSPPPADAVSNADEDDGW